MASSIYDPDWVRKIIRDVWNFLSAQLGHWNKSKIIAMDCSMYEKLPAPVLDGLATEAGNFHNTPCAWVQDGANLNVYVLGSSEVFDKHMAITATGLTVWDPLGKHTPPKKAKARGRLDGQPRRPPNAFILYRKDKHPEIKKMYPDIHNNEISVLVGNMWKSESEEVRHKYHIRSTAIKRAFLSAQPDYKYSPRKPEDIQRRKKHIPLERPNGRELDVVMVPSHEEVIRQLFPGTVGITTDMRKECVIAQEYGPTKRIRTTNIAGWTPATMSEEYIDSGLPLPFDVPPIDQVALFGQVAPKINFDGACISPAPTETAQTGIDGDLQMAELFGDMMMDSTSTPAF